MKLMVDCTPLHSGGGVQVAIAFLLNLQQRNEIDWTTLVPERMRAMLPGCLQEDERLHFIRKDGRSDVFRIRSALKRLENGFSPDAVFTVFGPPYFNAQAPHIVGFGRSDILYKPLVRVDLRTRAIHAITNRLRFRQLKKSDHLVVETETIRRRLARVLNVSDEKIAVIGNSLNPVLARHSPEKPPARGPFALLIPSTYYPHKNLEIVPEVAKSLTSLSPSLDFEFQFTLKADDAPWQSIAKQADKLGVGHRLKTLGPLTLDQLAGAYKAGSAVFLPTVREASTAVYPESFHFERPLVTSDLDFARELCGEAALFVPPFDAAAIARTIATLTNSPDLIQDLVAKGRRHLENTYPDQNQKFELQIELLRRVHARNRLAQTSKGGAEIPMRASASGGAFRD